MGTSTDGPGACHRQCLPDLIAYLTRFGAETCLHRPRLNNTTQSRVHGLSVAAGPDAVPSLVEWFVMTN